MLPPRAYIFISLNVVRLLSIVGLLLVFASSIVVMVDDIEAVNAFVSDRQNPALANSTTVELTADCDYITGSTVPNQPAGVFWAVLNRLLIIFQVIVLLLSELGWPYKFFDRYFPVLGTDFGLGALGVFQCLIGAAVLSHHVDDFALVSAFFLFSVGCVNILIGLIFREKAKAKRSIISWRAEKKAGRLPSFTQEIKVQAGPNPNLPWGTARLQSSRLSSSSTLRADENGALSEKNSTTHFSTKHTLIKQPLEALNRGAMSPLRTGDSRSSQHDTGSA